jgi:hypothetical protein
MAGTGQVMAIVVKMPESTAGAGREIQPVGTVIRLKKSSMDEDRIRPKYDRTGVSEQSPQSSCEMAFL